MYLNNKNVSNFCDLYQFLSTFKIPRLTKKKLTIDIGYIIRTLIKNII